MLNIIYSGIKLNEISRNMLLKLFQPKYNNIFADHLTLSFGSNILPINFGETTKIKILRYVYNNYCQAIECQLLDKTIKCNNIYPYITISTANNIKPIYSNTLLALPENQCISVNLFNQNIILTGRIGIFIKDNKWLFKIN